VWQAALNRLAALLKAAERARRGVRQAIVVVHGIGEQRPGQTGRDFTGALFGDSMVGGDASIHLKPDLLSPLYDMHMYRVRGDLASQRPPTDVYELYWANLMRDTTLGQVVRWVIPLFFAPNKRITPTLLKHVWGLRLLVILIVAAAGWTWHSGTWSAAVSALGAVGLLALAGAAAKVAWEFARDKFVISYVGDAARYLEPTPDNIERRQEIRRAGVDLLERLHDEGAYQRIIVVGHSLGSVIAYDVLSATWIRRGRRNEYAKRMKSKALVAAEDLLNPRDPSAAPPTSSEIRARQYAAWHEYRRNGFDWRVSDFVTLGSPLAHARLLLNLDKTSSFDELVANRSLPTCPPQVEWRLSPKPGVCRKVFSFTHAYRDERYPWHTSSVQVPHYAGLFALTRWSNLYFPLRGVLGGDPVGGALQATFGHWIDDIEVENPKPGPFGFAHTLYWTPSSFSSHIVRLRAALALPYATTLEDLSPPSPETLAQVRD
jgi:hypothetical protein